LLANRDGKLIGWGRNDFGQLGDGGRENKLKPRVNTSVTEAIIRLETGSQHAVAVSRLGNILSWGGNRKGQLGNGTFTSDTVPRIIESLQHRPVVGLACGESHTLVITVTGNVYAWGNNRYTFFARHFNCYSSDLFFGIQLRTTWVRRP